MVRGTRWIVFLAVASLFFPAALRAEGTPATEGKTMIVYLAGSFFTLNAVCFRQTECEQEVVSLLKKTPWITGVMPYSRQGAIMADFERGKVKPEEITQIAQKTARLMEEKGFGKYELRTTGSRTIPNKLAVKLLPTRITAASERFA